MYGHSATACDHSHDVSIICHPSTVGVPVDPYYNAGVAVHSLPDPHIPMQLRLSGGSRVEGRVEVRANCF